MVWPPFSTFICIVLKCYEMKYNLKENLEILRAKSPLVHNITNYVVMNFTANALLAAGASPVMAHAVEEVEDMVSIAGALVINIGTLSPHWVDGMALALKKAKALNVPIVLDPVGAGATPYRNKVLQRLLSVAAPTIIRGNASEIMALAGLDIQTKGVDSTVQVTDSLGAAQQLSAKYGSVVSVSGPADLIVAGDKIAYVHNGVPLMTRVTGMGCTASALAGAFAAIQPDPFDAAVSAAVMMGISGQLAAEKSNSPGTFQVAFLDALFNISSEELARSAKIQ